MKTLTCKNHPHLRWSCKAEAWSGFYNGQRRIFFLGVPTGREYADGSGIECSHVIYKDGQAVAVAKECDCPTSDLVLAPENGEN